MSDKKGERRFEVKLDGDLHWLNVFCQILIKTTTSSLVSLSLVKLMVNANEC